MRTMILEDATGVGHVSEMAGRPPTPDQLATVCTVLRAQHIPLTTHIDQQWGIPIGAETTVHAYALAVLSTRQEVLALRAIAAVTDARLAWHAKAAANV